VLHRDLKPDNIMVGKYGETLVVDWGLAKPIGRPDLGGVSEEKPLSLGPESGIAQTRSGDTLGTPAYMSPEQAAGALDRLGPASDVYSLGPRSTISWRDAPRSGNRRSPRSSIACGAGTSLRRAGPVRGPTQRWRRSA
jgi:serine/threonine protein kinase